MMVSVSHLFTLISLFSGVLVAAEDVSSQKADSVDSKFFGSFRPMYTSAYNYYGLATAWRNSWVNTYVNPSCYAVAYTSPFRSFGLPYNYYFKSADSQQQRRSIQLKTEKSQPAQSAAEESNVQCKNAEGQPAVFNIDECKKAAAKLVQERTSTGVHGKCSLTIVGPKGPLVATGVSANQLQAVTENMLKSCGASAPNSHAKSAPSGTRDHQDAAFALLLSTSGAS